MTTHQEDNSRSHYVISIPGEIEGIITEKYRYSQGITDTIEPPKGKHWERKCGLPCLTWLPKMPRDTNYHFVEKGGSLSAFTLLQRTMVKTKTGPGMLTSINADQMIFPFQALLH